MDPSFVAGMLDQGYPLRSRGAPLEKREGNGLAWLTARQATAPRIHPQYAFELAIST